MPARRSRTERWRESLHELRDRNGPIEISVSAEGGKSLVWRVRLFEIDGGDLIVERPVALRQRVPIRTGTELVGAIAIGQNRWMFLTSVIDETSYNAGGRQIESLRLRAPTSVERCQRRSFFRISTAALDLPSTRLAYLPDPSAGLPLEVATQAALVEAASVGHPGPVDPGDLAMPLTGPTAEASLVNLGGGGACLRVPPEGAAMLDRVGAFLLRVDLTPTIALPLPITARLAHCRVDSSQHVHAGFSFDFSNNRAYERFIGEQVCRYVASLQAGPSRRVA
ncbi:MAG: hypothetical protein AAGF47_10765 [Planctomycetota bacterium]